MNRVCTKVDITVNRCIVRRPTFITKSGPPGRGKCAIAVSGGGVEVLENLLTPTTYYVGKGIILFTMFYCTLNWAHYRNLRKLYDNDPKQKDDKDVK